jgi:hypothetical protein
MFSQKAVLDSFIELIYGGDVEKFKKEYKSVIGTDFSFDSPSAGLVMFVRKKWGLSSDALLELPTVAKGAREGKVKLIKNPFIRGGAK